MLKIVPTPEFVRQVKKLAKSYKNISMDIVRLLLIYAKTQRESVSDREIQEVIQKNDL